jgi:hypothetical protein
LRRLGEAFRRSVDVEAEVVDAVQAARQAGYSWAAIACSVWDRRLRRVGVRRGRFVRPDRRRWRRRMSVERRTTGPSER